MIFRSIIICWLITLSPFLCAQESFHFEGDIILGDIASYPYKLVFEEDNGILSGYSITDFEGNNETKSTISGVVDYARNTIEFQEDELVYAYDLDFKDKFCFIHFKGNLNDVGAKKQIQGRFNSMFENGERYVFGLINIFKTDPPLPPEREDIVATNTIISNTEVGASKIIVASAPDALAIELAPPIKKKEPVERIATYDIENSELISTPNVRVQVDNNALAIAQAPPAKKVIPITEEIVETPLDPVKIEKEELPQAPKPTKKPIENSVVASVVKNASKTQVNTVNKDEVLNIYCEEDSLSMFIYDEDRGDDDAINLYVDGQPVLVSYRVTPRVKKVIFKIVDDSVTVKINAINTGIIGRNTIRFDVKDGKNLIRTISNLDANDDAVLVFYKQ